MQSFGRCWVLLVPVGLGCQARGPEYPDIDKPLVSAPGATLAPASAPTPKPRATLYRDEVVRVVDAGLGRFLQRLSVDADLEHGRFRGFRILQLTPPEYWRSVDLKPGDVVTAVNGMSIERPVEAFQAFSSLPSAERLVVTYLRAGEARELVYLIRDRPGRARPRSPNPVEHAPRAPNGAGATPARAPAQSDS